MANCSQILLFQIDESMEDCYFACR